MQEVNFRLLYILKTPIKQRFSGVFCVFKIGTLAGNGLKYIESHSLIPQTSTKSTHEKNKLDIN